MQFIKLGNIVKIKTGKLDANAKVEGGKYPFFTCARDISWIDKPTYDCECVLVAGNGDLNVKYYHGKFDAYQRTYIIESNNTSELSMKYLYYFMQSYLEKLRGQTIGGVIQYIKMNNLTDIQIPFPSFEEQKSIVAKLDKLIDLIDLKKEAIGKTEELTKSVFLEMFGDPGSNPKGWEIKKLEYLVESSKHSLKTGPFGSALKKEFYVEKGWKIYGQEQVIKNSIYYGNYYISDEKYKELSNYSIKEGDVLISLVGSYGNLLIIPANFEPGIINPRLLKISFDKNIILPIFFKFYFLSESNLQKIDSIVHGGTMGILNLGLVKNLLIPIPPIELQNRFINIVQKNQSITEQQKQSLQKLQEFYNTTTQDIFSF